IEYVGCFNDQPDTRALSGANFYENAMTPGLCHALCADVGDFEYIGVQWIVAERTRDTTWLAILGAAQLLPTLFLGLLGGIVADRVNRKKLLIVTQFAMMLIAIAFFVVVKQYGHPLSDPEADKDAVRVLLNWMLGLSLLQGIVAAFNNPAWQVMIPRLVPRTDL
ncbi:MAG: MFS transporter, partial [Phycisphaerae bacterium]